MNAKELVLFAITRNQLRRQLDSYSDTLYNQTHINNIWISYCIINAGRQIDQLELEATKKELLLGCIYQIIGSADSTGDTPKLAKIIKRISGVYAELRENKNISIPVKKEILIQERNLNTNPSREQLITGCYEILDRIIDLSDFFHSLQLTSGATISGNIQPIKPRALYSRIPGTDYLSVKIEAKLNMCIQHDYLRSLSGFDMTGLTFIDFLCVPKPVYINNTDELTKLYTGLTPVELDQLRVYYEITRECLSFNTVHNPGNIPFDSYYYFEPGSQPPITKLTTGNYLFHGVRCELMYVHIKNLITGISADEKIRVVIISHLEYDFENKIILEWQHDKLFHRSGIDNIIIEVYQTSNIEKKPIITFASNHKK